MKSYYVLRMEGKLYEGMRIPVGLYHAITTTVRKHTCAQGNFEILLADTDSIKIGAGGVRNFREELGNAGNMILQNKLVTTRIQKGKTETVLEPDYTPHKAAVHILTAIELCKLCEEKKKGLEIKVEKGGPYNNKMTFDKKVKDADFKLCPYNAHQLEDVVEWTPSGA
jgi:hypothetical protein